MRKLVLAWLVAVSGLTLVAAGGSPTDRATGGGQVLIGTRGAGDTIAFTARGSATEAQGQVQYVDRTGGIGRGQTHSHGVVTCLAVTGNTAVIGGHWSSGDLSGPFEMTVVDNGEPNRGADVVTLHETTSTPADCQRDDDNESDDTPVALARGNAQVYDAE